MEVRIYWKAPNRPDNTHYLFSDVSKYLAKLEAWRAAVWDEDNYRFENGVLIVSQETAVFYEKYAYATFYDRERDFWRCYYVDEATSRGGKVYLSLSPDFWGTYIKDAEISDVYVARSNRLIKADCNFDPITVINPGAFVPWHPVGAVCPLNDLAVVLLVSMVTYNGGTPGQQNSVSQNKLFKFTPKDLIGADTNDYSDLPGALGNAGTLYQWNGMRQLFNSAMDARVLRAWLVPAEWLEVRNYGTGDATFTFRNVEADKDVTIRIGSTGGQVMPGVHDYGVATGLSVAQLIGNRVLFGTRARQVEMPRSNNATVKFRVYSYVTGIKVCLLVNGEEIDITDAFEATLTSDENMYTTTQQVVKALNFAVGGTLAAVKSYNRQGAVGALGSLVTTWGGGIEQALDVSANVGRNAAPGGDALTTYYGWIDTGRPGDTPNYVETPPFGFYLWPSNADEIERVDLDGALFGTYIEDAGGLAWVAQCASITGNEADAYVKGSCKVSGVPSYAAEAIEGTVSRGVYYEVLQ